MRWNLEPHSGKIARVMIGNEQDFEPRRCGLTKCFAPHTHSAVHCGYVIFKLMHALIWCAEHHPQRAANRGMIIVTMNGAISEQRA